MGASQIQKQQHQEKEKEPSELKESATTNSEGNINNPLTLSPLPRLSSCAAASMIASMSGSPAAEESGEKKTASTNADDELQAQTEALFGELQTSYKVGDKIYDTKDGKSIGQIVALPEEGTNVLLAQMRLDSVGLLRPKSSSRKRKQKKED